MTVKRLTATGFSGPQAEIMVALISEVAGAPHARVRSLARTSLSLGSKLDQVIETREKYGEAYERNTVSIKPLQRQWAGREESGIEGVAWQPDPEQNLAVIAQARERAAETGGIDETAATRPNRAAFTIAASWCKIEYDRAVQKPAHPGFSGGRVTREPARRVLPMNRNHVIVADQHHEPLIFELPNNRDHHGARGAGRCATSIRPTRCMRASTVLRWAWARRTSSRSWAA